MSNQEIVERLQIIVNNMNGIRLPVKEATAYSGVLKLTGQLLEIIEEIKEDINHDAANKPE